MNTPIISKEIDAKSYVWSGLNNQYAVLEKEIAQLITALSKGDSLSTLASTFASKNLVSKAEVLPLLQKLKEQFLEENKEVERFKNKEAYHTTIPANFETTYTYTSNNTTIRVAFQSELEASFVHPKFAHLTTQSTNFDIEFKVFIANDKIYLAINNKVKYGWSNEEIHYFQGKFSMEFIQAIYGNTEDDWLGVFHASAVSNKQKAVLFLGDSGNGKSTSLALLQKHGFQCMADDFVPIAATNKEVYHFPAAISVKNSSLQTLAPLYPLLTDTKEYHLKRLNKRVRYLPPNYTDTETHLACKDLVFIKYQKDVALSFTKISKQKAFEQLVPDSWLSPKKENATTFLEWFATLNCYQITYSQTNEMVASVSKIFNDDL